MMMQSGEKRGERKERVRAARKGNQGHGGEWGECVVFVCGGEEGEEREREVVRAGEGGECDGASSHLSLHVQRRRTRRSHIASEPAARRNERHILALLQTMVASFILREMVEG